MPCTVEAKSPSTRTKQTGLQEPVSLGTNPTAYPASGKSCDRRGSSELFDLGSLSLRNAELTSQPEAPHSPDRPFCSLGGPPDLVKGPPLTGFCLKEGGWVLNKAANALQLSTAIAAGTSRDSRVSHEVLRRVGARAGSPAGP